MTQVFFTDDGKDDLRKAKAYAKTKWGVPTRDIENNAVKAIVAALKTNPYCGKVHPMLAAIGMNDVRESLTTYNRVFHYYDEPNDSVYILMIIPAMRDFVSHFTQRMLNPPMKKGVPVNINLKIIK
jgi:plasmid stabilization system protein ParE